MSSWGCPEGDDVKLSRCYIILLLAALVTPAVSTADVYRYVDGSGMVSFTDNPGHGGYKIYIREASTRAVVPSPLMGYYPYRRVVEEACAVYEIEEPLVRAVMEVESDYNRYAMSGAGARGLMQLMPSTIKYLGVSNPWDPKQNIMGGTKYLKGLLDRFSGNVKLALAAYNAGTNAVIKYGRIPPYPQTRRYVVKVMDRYMRYSGMTSN